MCCIAFIYKKLVLNVCIDTLVHLLTIDFENYSSIYISCTFFNKCFLISDICILVIILVVSSMRASSTGGSSTDIAVIHDGDVSTCFSTDAADRAPFVALDYGSLIYVTSIEIKSRSDIGKWLFTIMIHLIVKYFVSYFRHSLGVFVWSNKARCKSHLILYSFTKHKHEDLKMIFNFNPKKGVMCILPQKCPAITWCNIAT